MSPSFFFEGVMCWVLVSCLCVFRLVLFDSRKILLFGTFSLILFGFWMMCNWLTILLWAWIFLPAFAAAVAGPGLQNTSSGVLTDPDMLFATLSYWWFVVFLLGLGPYRCTGFLNWVRPVVKLFGSSYQFWSRVYYQAWGWFQGMLILGRDYVLFAELESRVMAHLFWGRDHLGQVCFCMIWFSWGLRYYSIRPIILFVLLWCMRPTFEDLSKPKSSANSKNARPYFYLGKLKANIWGVFVAARMPTLVSWFFSSPYWALTIHGWPRFFARCKCSLIYAFGIKLWACGLAQSMLNSGSIFSCCCCMDLKAHWRVSIVNEDNFSVMYFCNSLGFVVGVWCFDRISGGKDIIPTSILKISRCCMFSELVNTKACFGISLLGWRGYAALNM